MKFSKNRLPNTTGWPNRDGDARPSKCAGTTTFLLLVCLFLPTACTPEKTAVHPPQSTPAATTTTPNEAVPTAAIPINPEEVRRACIAGRRLICGKVLKVSPDGLVVDSGYTDLLRSPLTQSWIVPGDVSASRDPNVLELDQPGTPCIGLAFLTDLPKRRKVKKFDYVILMGYPAGQYVYAPVPNVEKTIRKFSAGLETAVRLSLHGEDKAPATGAPGLK